ncbi:hypothetical protein HOY80DRAFT_1085886 [Tuber brumale]|nr:hypothetical protein HOY80DRAFT_1085886 [Tuber brumale]
MDKSSGKLEEEQFSALATDQDLGDIINFYNKGTICMVGGSYLITRRLLDAGSTVNLMPIGLPCFVGARLRKAAKMVIQTATQVLALIPYCVEVRIKVAELSCDLHVYALPTLRSLHAMKAKGDNGRKGCYMMTHHEARVKAPRDARAEICPHRYRMCVQAVMSDRDKEGYVVSMEIEEELEWQQLGGGRFFQDLVELAKRQAEEEIKYDDEGEDSGSSD